MPQHRSCPLRVRKCLIAAAPTATYHRLIVCACVEVPEQSTSSVLCALASTILIVLARAARLYHVSWLIRLSAGRELPQEEAWRSAADSEAIDSVEGALLDDMNTPQAIAALSGPLKAMNELLHTKKGKKVRVPPSSLICIAYQEYSMNAPSQRS